MASSQTPSDDLYSLFHGEDFVLIDNPAASPSATPSDKSLADVDLTSAVKVPESDLENYQHEAVVSFVDDRMTANRSRTATGNMANTSVNCAPGIYLRSCTFNKSP